MMNVLATSSIILTVNTHLQKLAKFSFSVITFAEPISISSEIGVRVKC